MQDGDAAVFFNFRPDRAREITRALVDPAFAGFERGAWPQVSFACLTEYDPEIPAPVAFPKEFPDNVLADVLAAAGLRQYHIAETEKYAHVTFFLNGGREEPKAGEERALVPSPKVATYDLKPEMSEPDVAATLAAAIEAGEADVYIVNFANCDMVGHTGRIPAAVAAVEAVDAGVGQVLAALERKGGVALVTADHGNADKMLGEDGSALHGAHHGPRAARARGLRRNRPHPRRPRGRALRHRADAARAHGPAEARRDDGQEPARVTRHDRPATRGATVRAVAPLFWTFCDARAPAACPACQGRRFSGILHDLCKRSFSMERRETP